MRVLVACEFSARVRDAFRARGHDAWSCDLIDTDGDPQWHIKGDALEAAEGGNWDLLIAFPPCTYLCSSGLHWNTKRPERWAETDKAVEFVKLLASVRIPRIAIENPVGILSTRWRKPDQIIQPWMFGHGETKQTCLWLKGLPKLVPTDVVDGRAPVVHKASQSKDRWKKRSLTYLGVAEAMAAQWSV